ncbi:MAG: NUDIX hydrolase [Actinomycetota bacterium]
MTDQQDRRAGTGAQAPGTGGDYDPDAIPVREAATVLIIDERPDLQVLMLKRNARSIFVGDMWVFPGGAVDEADRHPDVEDLVEGWSDDSASRRIARPAGGLGFWVAALRETFEEAGLLLAGERDGGHVVAIASGDARFDRHRDSLNAGQADFASILRTEGLTMRAADMHYVSQWITPLGPPRRYDTRFFVTERPQTQVPLHDDDEAVHHEWVSPADAIEANVRDEMVMMTPTVAMLQRLATFGSVDEAMSSASAAGPEHDEAIRIRFDDDGPHRIAFPADPDYADADPKAEHGVISWPAGTLPIPGRR